VRVHAAEARSFVARGSARWELIQIPLLDSFGAAVAGVQSLSESYVYTVEAFRHYLRHLAPGGYLAITRWLKLPPRDSLKLFATALTALEREGVARPQRRLALIRSWNTTTLLVKNGALDAEEIGRIHAFADERSFDLAYYAGMQPDEANRFNLLERPYFFDGAMALAGPDRAAFMARYKFDLAPATDDRPYFFDFFRWRSLPEFLALRRQGGAALLEWGYLILVATLVQAAALSLVLILLPLRRLRRRAPPHPDRRRILAYFLALGLAFLFVEIAFIQKFILFLSHPLYSVAVVLSGFLVFAGIGSALSERLVARALRARLSPVPIAVAGITLVALSYVWLLPVLFQQWLGLADALRILLSILLIAPLAVCMGMPFPIGLKSVGNAAPAFIPWAWGINGFASVVSATLATLLAIQFGFNVVLSAAIVLYICAALIFCAGR